MFLANPAAVFAAYTSAVVGSTATMVGDATADNLAIAEVGGLFSHNRFDAGDPGFNSDIDFDTTVAGDQTISSTTGVINISAGDGNDSIVLADGIDLRGAIDGGDGIDDTIDYTAFATAIRANLGLGTTGSARRLAPTRRIRRTRTLARPRRRSPTTASPPAHSTST